MPTLLHIDSSPLGEYSVSRHLSAEFVRNWKRANPDGTVVTRDLPASSLTLITGEWVTASFTAKDVRSDAQRRLLAPSDALIAELRSADAYAIGVPMHNFTIPSTLRLWIDLIARAGETFAYGEAGPVGLLEGKTVTFLTASGGVYGPGTPMASYNFVEPYLRTVFGFLGVTDTRFITAGGASAVSTGKVDRETFLKTPLEAIQASFPAAQGAVPTQA